MCIHKQGAREAMNGDEAHRVYEQGVAVGQRKGRSDRTHEILALIENQSAKSTTPEQAALKKLRRAIEVVFLHLDAYPDGKL
jgi:hypothetical protein